MKIPIVTPIVRSIQRKKHLSESREIAKTDGVWFYPFTEEEKSNFLKVIPPRFWGSEHVQRIYFQDPRTFISLAPELISMDKMKKRLDKQRLQELR